MVTHTVSPRRLRTHPWYVDALLHAVGVALVTWLSVCVPTSARAQEGEDAAEAVDPNAGAFVDERALPVGEGDDAYLLYYDQETWNKFRARASGDGYPRLFVRVTAHMGYASIRQSNGRFYERAYGSDIGGDLAVGISIHPTFALHLYTGYTLLMTRKVARSVASPNAEIKSLKNYGHTVPLGIGATLQRGLWFASISAGALWHQEGKRWGPGGDVMVGIRHEIRNSMSGGIGIGSMWGILPEKNAYFRGGMYTLGLRLYMAY